VPKACGKCRSWAAAIPATTSKTRFHPRILRTALVPASNDNSNSQLNPMALGLHLKMRAEGVQVMIVGAAIAGFLIVSLLLETLSSSPKVDEAEQPDVPLAPQ
jgi:hypothetical protein